MERQRHWPVRIVAGITLLNGLFAIAEVLMTRFPRRFEALLPINYEIVGRNFGLVAGFVLIYISSRLLARKRLAWRIALTASVVVVLSHLVFIRSFAPAVIALISLALLMWCADEFTVESEATSIKQGLGLIILSLIVAVAYGTFGFEVLLRRDFGHDFTIGESILRTLREYCLIGNDDLRPRTIEARWFLSSLDMIGVASLGAALLGLFRPLNYRYATLPAERTKARKLIDRYDHSSEADFKLWPHDKSYFFGTDGQSVVAYRVVLGVAIALGEPTGPSGHLAQIIDEFGAFAHRSGWATAYLYVSSEHLPNFTRADLRNFMIGQDAVVATAQFCEETVRNKQFRAVMNKFRRLGYSFELLSPPYDQPTLRRLHEVSNAWLGRSGHGERGFALGYFDSAHLGKLRNAVVRNEQGEIVAFANLIDSRDPNRASIDLMRYVPGVEANTMDYLLAELILWLHAQSIAELNLGLAPLTATSDRDDAELAERLVYGLARYNVAGFAFQGLRKYKNKYDPRWEDRYLLYEPGRGGLPAAGLAVTRAMNVKVDNKDKK